MPTFRHPGTVLTDHAFEVPLDHADPHGARITVFAREVVAAEKAAAATGELPWLCFSRAVPDGRARGRTAAIAGWTVRCGTTASCCSTSAAPAGPPPLT